MGRPGSPQPVAERLVRVFSLHLTSSGFSAAFRQLPPQLPHRHPEPMAVIHAVKPSCSNPANPAHSHYLGVKQTLGFKSPSLRLYRPHQGTSTSPAAAARGPAAARLLPMLLTLEGILDEVPTKAAHDLSSQINMLYWSYRRGSHGFGGR